MNYGWLNIGSILCGLIAVVIPIINLMREDKSSINNLGILSSVSISACSISLCIQIFYANHLVNIRDFTAMMDIFSIVTRISAALVVSTIVLNIITYMIHNEKIKYRNISK